MKIKIVIRPPGNGNSPIKPYKAAVGMEPPDLIGRIAGSFPTHTRCGMVENAKIMSYFSRYTKVDNHNFF
jgi:hypothetical protein